jgi:hypothetical protein
MNEEEILARKDVYTNIVSPLSNLPGLARFFLHLYDPNACETVRLERPALDALNQYLEKGVMGETYDAVIAGKKAFRRSRWLEDDDRADSLGASIE